jgi:hypothetical protein
MFGQERLESVQFQSPVIEESSDERDAEESSEERENVVPAEMGEV